MEWRIYFLETYIKCVKWLPLAEIHTQARLIQFLKTLYSSAELIFWTSWMLFARKSSRVSGSGNNRDPLGVPRGRNYIYSNLANEEAVSP